MSQVFKLFREWLEWELAPLYVDTVLKGMIKCSCRELDHPDNICPKSTVNELATEKVIKRKVLVRHAHEGVANAGRLRVHELERLCDETGMPSFEGAMEHHRQAEEHFFTCHCFAEPEMARTQFKLSENTIVQRAIKHGAVKPLLALTEQMFNGEGSEYVEFLMCVKTLTSMHHGDLDEKQLKAFCAAAKKAEKYRDKRFVYENQAAQLEASFAENAAALVAEDEKDASDAQPTKKRRQ